MNQAAKFLHEAANAKETQDALLSLTQHVLRHPDTVKEVTGLVKLVVNELHLDEVGTAWTVICCVLLRWLRAILFINR